MINNYFYDAQLRTYLLQFCNIFAGLKVQTGKDACGENEFITVPISVGARDRVVAAIQSGNTQNRAFSVPAMVANISGLQLSPNRKGTGVIDRKVYLPEGGVFPNDLQTMVRVMPIPYIMTTELSLMASNTQQAHQMLEQLLVLFDPTLQIQTSDSAFDWTKISSITLNSISSEETYPLGTSKRVITWTLSFEMPIYISIPATVKDDIVRNINIRIGDLAKMQVTEFDENGNLVPFLPEDVWAEINIQG